MPKVLSLAGLTIAALLFLIFLLDLILGFAMPAYAPFKGFSLLMDVTFLLCSGGLAFMAWQTFKSLD
jgi:hypothetical protein